MLRINGSILDLNGLGPYTVELNWAIHTAGITLPDIHSVDIPINPAIYDTPVGDSLPYHHNNNKKYNNIHLSGKDELHDELSQIVVDLYNNK